MEYKVVLDDLFFEHLARFSESERRIIYNKIEILKANPGHRSLRTQSLHRFEDFYESSVSMGIRVIWELDEDTIIFHDVGRHDILKKYG
jgi:mRNA-degrading endonuclease RelE of RelBE toxin-antitoxin system